MDRSCVVTFDGGKGASESVALLSGVRAASVALKVEWWLERSSIVGDEGVLPSFRLMTFDANIASLLTDAHAHPTDDPTLRAGDEQGLQDLAQRLCEVPLGRVCAMSSCSGDQELVRNLALEVRRLQAEGSSKKSSMDLRPCFGELASGPSLSWGSCADHARCRIRVPPVV